MRIIAGIILIVAGVTFLVWKLISYETSFFFGMLLNILGFMPIAFGFLLLGFKKENLYYQNSEMEKTKKPEFKEETKLKDFNKEDHSKYTPK